MALFSAFKKSINNIIKVLKTFQNKQFYYIFRRQYISGKLNIYRSQSPLCARKGNLSFAH